VTPEIERLYREHRAGLVRLVERELQDHHDAEDVVQTAFLDAQRALERGTIPRNPHAWLAAIALNAGRRLRRRRLNAQPVEEFAVQEASAMPEIRAALATLPAEQRAAVVYRDLLGLSYGETAAKMGTSVNAVTMLLHRGRRRLRQTLAALVGGFGLWRWLHEDEMPQVAVAKGAAAFVAAAGLATTGVVVARVVAPAGADAKGAAPVARSVSRGVSLALDSAHRRVKTTVSSMVSSVPAPTQAPMGDAAAPSAPSPTTAVTSSPPPSTLPVPTVSPPTLPISTPAATVPATVTVSTPVATVSVTIPAATTVTVTTPITTVTLPIP
jgi:RNA polymerase sigma-70 factor (ECF subfamily)